MSESVPERELRLRQESAAQPSGQAVVDPPQYADIPEPPPRPTAAAANEDIHRTATQRHEELNRGNG